MSANTAPRAIPEQDLTRNTRAGVPARDWLIIGLLLAFFTLNFADKAAIGVAAPDIEADLGLSASQYGMVSSSFFWLFAVGAVLLTVAVRRISWRWSAALLMAAWLVSMAPLTAPTTLGVLLMSRIALGFFEGPAFALCQSIVMDRFAPQRRAFAGAVVNSGSSLGPLVATPALTWLIVTWNWHTGFAVLIAAGLLWFAVWLWATRHEPGARRLRITGARPSAVADDPNAGIDVPFVSLLRNRSFWGVALLCSSGYLITSLKVAWLPSFLHQGMGYSQSTVGLLATLPYGLDIVVLLAAGLVSGRLLKAGFSSRVARSHLTMGLLCVSGLSMIVFSRLPPGGLQLALVVVSFSINSVAFAITFAGAADFLPRKHRAGFFGCSSALYSLAGIVAPWALGAVVDAGTTVADGYDHGFLLTGIAICVLAVGGGLLLDPARSRETLLAETARRRATKGVPR
ncbi:MFS transporter [Streptomyces sp. NBC_00963]|uniref:MFS transporter n=1 Tax=Streptomyces sp. NBC_00963 TaxID=2903697 RepID=UPI0038668A3F|nr:MFS transporter [Streptomyces sp. NBC_00963]